MTVVLVVAKINGCPACNDLQTNLPTIVRDMRSLPQLADMREEVYILTRGDKTIPYALRSIERVPMLFLVPANIWDAAKMSPDENIPLTSSTIYNGEWVHHKATLLAEQRYRRVAGESVSASYMAWARDTLQKRDFQRVQGEVAYPAIPLRPSSSSSREKPPCKIQIIRYKSASSRK